MFIVPGGIASSGGGFIFGTSAAAISEVDASSYTFSGMSIGTATTDRDILLFARSYGLSGIDHDLTGCTIGGVTATLVGELTQASRHSFSVHVARVPTGATADVVMTFDADADELSIVTLPVRGVGTFGGFSFTRADDLSAPYDIALTAQNATDPFRLLVCEHFLSSGMAATTVTNMTQISNNTSTRAAGGGTSIITGFQEPSTVQPYFTLDSAMSDIVRGVITLQP